MKGAGFYLSEWLSVLQTNYPAKVVDINERSGSEFSGEMEAIAFFSRYEGETAKKHPALYLLPRQGRIADVEASTFSYEFEIIVSLIAKKAVDLMRDLAEHELAISEIVSEHWTLTGITRALVDQVNYDSVRQRGSPLMGELKLGLYFETQEPRRFLTTGAGGAF